MNKELIDSVWACLPREFKEEVRELYDGCIKMMDIRPSASEIYANKLTTLECLFGIHNLTSDVEGEEMLYVKAKTVREMYAANDRLIAEFIGSEIAKDAAIINNMLRRLYSSKCLPDENYSNVEKLEKNDEPKPAEPKFKVGDKVKDISSPHDDGIYKVDDIKKSSDGFIYHIQGLIGVSNVKESDLEPYTEPTANYMQVDYHGADTAASTIADGCQSQPVTDCHDFNRILKDSFRDHNRLQIAAMAMQGLLSNTTRFSSYEISDLVRISLNCAEALIAESEKGGTKMNYDITFCEGENCARKEECHRYRELLRFRADKDPTRKDYISMCKPDPTKCTLFWREKGGEDGED